MLEYLLHFLVDITDSDYGVIAFVETNEIYPLFSKGKKYTHIEFSDLTKKRKYIDKFTNYDKKIIILEDNILISCNKLHTLDEKIISNITNLGQSILNSEIEQKSLLSYLGHEIKTSLTSTDGFSQLLKYADNDMQKKEYLDIISNSNYKIIDIVDTVLDYSYLSLNKTNLLACNIKDCIIDTISTVKYDNIINYNIDKLLYKNVMIDSVKLKQLLINLLKGVINLLNTYNVSNVVAVKYKQLVEDNICKLFIGIGIEKINEALLFELRNALIIRFETRKNKKIYDGIDFNLQIVKKLTDVFNGVIYIENLKYNTLCIYTLDIPQACIMEKGLLSEIYCMIYTKNIELRLAINSFLEMRNVNCMSFFSEEEIKYFMDKFQNTDKILILLSDFHININTICINISDWVTDDITDNFIIENITKSFDINKSNIHILVVEDNINNQMIITNFLKILEWDNVNVVNNGKEALKFLEDNDVNVIFMDINMPVLDGWSTFKEIKKIYGKKRPYVIALTAYLTREESDNIEMDDYVSKPITDISKLELVLKKYIFKNNYKL